MSITKSFIISYHKDTDRDELNLKKILTYLLKVLDSTCEIVLVEQGETETVTWLNQNNKINYILIKSNKPFNKGWGYNIGVKKAKGTNIILHDITSYLRYKSYRVDRLLNTFGVIKPYNREINLNGNDSNKFLSNFNYSILIGQKNVDYNNSLTRIFMIKKSNYLKIGGFDESVSYYMGQVSDFEDKIKKLNLSLRILNDICVNVVNKYVFVDNSPLKNNKNKISIILIDDKSYDFIEKCLDSIENQTFFNKNNNYEILLGINNCKKTYDLINSIKYKYRNLKVFMINEDVEKNIIINTLIDYINYENIIIFNASDIMFLDMVEKIINNKKDHNLIRYKYQKNIEDTINKNDDYSDIMSYYHSSIFEKMSGFDINNETIGDFIERGKELINELLINDSLFFKNSINNDIVFVDKIKKENTKIKIEKKITNFKKTKVNQIRLSGSVDFFKEKMMVKYNLKEYNNPNEPCIFMGLYKDEDYMSLMNHNNEAIILWCGSDGMKLVNFINKYNLFSEKFHHIAFGQFVSDDLKKYNIKHKVIPITPSDFKGIEPKKRGENIYMYSGKNSKFYGSHYINKIKKRTNLNIILAHYDSYTYDELLKIYESCFIGLRLTPHDGLPNTVCELGLMGRRCIYNGNLPNTIPWKNIDDICENILKEYNNKHINDIEKIHNDMKSYLDISDDWLYLEYYKNPNVSVIMNSYNEKPEYFLQAINSYLNQKNINLELIVSTVKGDPCITVCKNYPIKIVINEKPSIWHQLNEGMKVATGDWITYASSNDVSDDNKLINEINLCLKNNKEVCYSDFYQCDSNLNVQSVTKFNQYDYKRHLQGNFVSDCAVFSKRLLDKYYPFKVEFANFAYYDFWLRIYEGEGNVFYYNNKPTWYYRITEKSRHIAKKDNKELIELEKKQKEEMLNKRKICIEM